ncbi:MAG: 5-formyltetrahydrofolate cyclo-ligase [Bacteroidota bacterium]
MNKAALRKYYLTERKKLSEEQLSYDSQAICTGFFNWITSHYSELKAIQSIHCFLPIRKQKEVDTYLIIDHLRKQFPHIQLIISRVRLSDYSLENFVWNEHLQVQENAWGIPEPMGGDPFPAEKIDLVLIPLLIFDQNGHRVGYGKGFYDRFLAECRLNTLKVGLSLFEPIAAISDTTEHDIRLDACITPEQLWTFGSSEG